MFPLFPELLPLVADIVGRVGYREFPLARKRRVME